MKIVKVKDMNIDVPNGSAFNIKTGPNMLKAHQNSIFIGKRGSGKSVAVTNYLKMLKKEGSLHRIFVISPTFNSNKKLMKSLDIDSEDVYEPDDAANVINDIIKKAEEERDIYLKYHEDLKKWNLLMDKLNNRNIFIDDIDPELLLEFLTSDGFEKPVHKYNGERPILAVFVDDCQSTNLFRTPKFLNFITRHRHIADFETGGALGISCFTCIQNFKSQMGGCPRAVKNNATSLAVFRMKDKKELQEIFESCAGEIDEKTFYEVYAHAINEPHSFLLIDLHKKENHPSMFRKRFDEYIVPEKTKETI